MAEMIKVGILGIVGVLLAVQFKTEKPQYATYIGIAMGILLFSYALGEFSGVVRQLEAVREYLGGGEGYLSILLKVVGITYICEFCADICKDAGYGAIAAQVEILGKLSVMLAGLPILFGVMEQIRNMMR